MSSAGVAPHLCFAAIALIATAACGEPEFGHADPSKSYHATRQDAMHQDAGDVWAMQWIIPVRWNKNLAIDADNGEVIHHAKSLAFTQGRVRTDHVRLCGVQQPAYRLRPFLGKEQYQALYPTNLFDSESLPPCTMTTQLGESGGFVAQPLALMLGGTIDDPEHAPWPAPGTDFPGTPDIQADGSSGFASIMRTDPPFIGPPVNMTRTRRAEVFHVVMRHLVGGLGAFVNDGFAEGRAQVGGIDGKAALNMRVVGCRIQNGSSCTDAELYDLNKFSPAYVVTGPGKFVMQRVHADTSCADIRTMAFAP